MPHFEERLKCERVEILKRILIRSIPPGDEPTTQKHADAGTAANDRTSRSCALVRREAIIESQL